MRLILLLFVPFSLLQIREFSPASQGLLKSFSACNCAVRLKSSEPEIKIGDQIWMLENLNSERFKNGDKIPQAKNFNEWTSACLNMKPTWCYYDFDPSNNKKYGKLYNIAALWDARELAPDGWHIPSESEWMVLINHLGGDSLAADKLKSLEGWNCGSDDTKCNGSNSSGFSAMASGSMGYKGRYFLGKGFEAAWWTSSTDETNPLQAEQSVVVLGRVAITVNKYEPYMSGLSVRCIKNH